MLGNLSISRGTARGTRLIQPSKDNTRATSNKVRQAIVNILQFELKGKSVLDLFAGSGAFGLECLSAGAASCSFVDWQTIDVIEENLEKTELSGDLNSVDFRDYLEFCDKQYDIIFLDPPYDTNYIEIALNMIHARKLARDYIICETDRELDIKNFEVLDIKKYGNTFIYILKGDI